MVQNRPRLGFFRHAVLLIGVAIVMFPIFVALVASTHSAPALQGNFPGWFGDRLRENYSAVLGHGMRAAGGAPVGVMMFNSLVMALAIAIGKDRKSTRLNSSH